MRDQIEKKNNRGTTRKVEEHFPRHVQGLGLRKNRRRTPEKLFGGPTEAKEPQKRHVQGSDGRNRYEGWLVGVRRGWRRKRVVGKCLTRPHAPARKMQLPAGKTCVDSVWVVFLAPVLWEKLEISSKCSLQCRKKTLPEKFAGKVAGGECFLTTIQPTGKLWGLGKVTGMKHGHRKVTGIDDTRKLERIRFSPLALIPC